MNELQMNEVQCKAHEIILSEAKFLYNIIKYDDRKSIALVIIAMLPYLGVFIDGVSEWSIAMKISSPKQNEAEKKYYEFIRQGIKIFDEDFEEVVNKTRNESIKQLKYWKDRSKYNFAVNSVENHPFINSVSLSLYLDIEKLKIIFNKPRLNQFSGRKVGKQLKKVSKVAGKIVAYYTSDKQKISLNQLSVKSKDYQLFNKTTFNISGFDDLAIFNLLCQINFIIHFLYKITEEENTFVLRCAYITYYHAFEIIQDINIKTGQKYYLNKKWFNRKFRNSMAHYGLGVELKENTLKQDDIFGGLTDKFFNKTYKEFKFIIGNELENLSSQLELKYMITEDNLTVST